MENLSKESLLKIISFYKTKVSDLELEYVVMQVNKNNEIQNLINRANEKYEEYLQGLEKAKQDTSELVKAERELKEKEIAAIVKKYNLKVNNKKNNKQ